MRCKHPPMKKPDAERAAVKLGKGYVARRCPACGYWKVVLEER